MQTYRLIPIKEGDKCFACSPERDKGGRMIRRRTKTGVLLKTLYCSRSPECKNKVMSKKVSKHPANRIW